MTQLCGARSAVYHSFAFNILQVSVVLASQLGTVDIFDDVLLSWDSSYMGTQIPLLYLYCFSALQKLRMYLYLPAKKWGRYYIQRFILMFCKCPTGLQRIAKLAWNCRYFRRHLHEAGFIVYGCPDSPVVPLLIYVPCKGVYVLKISGFAGRWEHMII